MKRLGFYILLACLAFACQKEDEITPGIGYENLYAIVDNPDDSVQHKRYELYTTYGVPVYFNDTIGKVFVKLDVNGDSVFHYETLDLNWAYNSTNSGSVTYHVTRLTDPDQQMKALRFAEVFFQNSQPGIYPYALWLTQSCYEISSSGAVLKNMITRYRNLMFAGAQSITEANWEKTAVSYRNDIVKQKVQVYDTELKAFNEATDRKYYDQMWKTFYPDEILPYYSDMLPAWVECSARALEEEWDPALPVWTYRRYMTTPNYGNNSNDNFPMGVWTDEDFENYIVYTRGFVGGLGFVTYSVGYMGVKFTPRNTTKDLEYYLTEMLKYPRKEFLERWGSCPLVLKKYEILYAIIRDKLGVEL